MKPRDTRKKPKPRCELCGELLINRRPHAKFCKECGRTMKNINKNQNSFMKKNKEILEEKDKEIERLKNSLKSQKESITTLKEFTEDTGIMLDRNHFNILKFIYDEGVVNFKDIRKKFDIVKKTVATRVKKLEELKLIEIEKSGVNKLIRLKTNK